MKKTKLFLMAIIAPTVLFVSCEKEDTNTSGKSDITTKSNFVGMGEVHNNGLDAIYRALVNTANLTEADSETIGEDIGEAFLLNENSLNDEFGLEYQINVNDTDFTSATELYSGLSPELTSELIIVEQAFDSYVDNGNIADFYDYTRTIIDDAPQNLTADEQLAWQHGVDVMGSSCQYWNANMLDWVRLNPNFDEGAIQTLGFWRRLWDFIKPTVKADFVGAVKGALGGVIGGGAGMAAGAASGGLGASAGNVIERLWNEIVE